MILDLILASSRAVAETWRDEATRRRKISPTDPVADTMEFCATELLDHLQGVDRQTHWLGSEDFAQLHGVTPQTVRNWIRNSELEAVKTEKGGYMINRHATRQRSA